MLKIELSMTSVPIDLRTADLDCVSNWLDKAVVEFEKQEGSHETGAKALTDYAMSLLRDLSQESGQISTTNKAGYAAAQPNSHPADISGTHCSQQHPALVDTHVLDLHKQVLEKMTRVKALRAEVPALISQTVQGELEGMRPLVTSIEHLTALSPPKQGCDLERQKGGGLAGGGEELQAMLAGTLDKLPALRARLEQTVQRLARITAAVDAEQGRSSPLKTVEKVLLNRPDDDTENVGDQQAIIADGSQATRRRLAKDLNGKIL